MPETNHHSPEPSDENENPCDPWESAMDDLDVEGLDPSEQLRRELLRFVNTSEAESRINHYFDLQRELKDLLDQPDPDRVRQIISDQQDIVEYFEHLYFVVGPKLRQHFDTDFAAYLRERDSRQSEEVQMMMEQLVYLTLVEEFIEMWEDSRQRQLMPEDFTSDKRYQLEMKLKDLYQEFKRKFHPEEADDDLQTFFLHDPATQGIMFSFLDELFPPPPNA